MYEQVCHHRFRLSLVLQSYRLRADVRQVSCITSNSAGFYNVNSWRRMPTFSLIIATYGRVDTVDRLFASIADGSGIEVECILVDQNADERMQPVLDRWRPVLDIQVVRCAPHSTSARNRGIAIAKGDFIGFPDDDCWYSPGLLSHVYAFFQDHPEYDILSIGVTDGDGVRSGNRWIQARCEIRPVNVFRTSVTYAFFYRRHSRAGQVYFDQEMGVSPTSLYGAEDTDFMLAALKGGARGYFTRGLLVHHPRNDMLSGAVPVQRAVSYGAGMGVVLRKYNMTAVFALFMLYGFARAFACLLSGRLRAAFLCLAHASGVWNGFCFKRVRPRSRV